MAHSRTVLLAALGAASGLIAFKIAAPFEDTLRRPGIDLTDPRALFTYGTVWGAVNRVAFGALIGGLFSYVLALGRKPLPRVIFCGVVGTILGGAVNFVTDSAADIVGIALSSRAQMIGAVTAMLAWCVLVPFGIAMVVAFSLGPTRPSLFRALRAAKVAFVVSFAIQIVGGTLGSVSADSATDSAGELLRSQIPLWRLVEIAAGLSLGVILGMADGWLRPGSMRLVRGRNEFSDWSLDSSQTRIGTAESSEIPLWGFNGVQPLHAVVLRQGNQFFLQPHGEVAVNGVSVGMVPLASGDHIALGSAELLFTLGVGTYPSAMWTAPSHQPGGFRIARLLFAKTGQELHLPPGRYPVGREPGNAVCLKDDHEISRRHAELLVTEHGVAVVDLGSKNGTRVNGRPVQGPQDLAPGDVIELGSAKFTYYQ